MKISRKFIAASSFIIASSAIIARADYINVSDQAVAFALTRTTYIGGTFETDQNSGKLTKIPAFNNVVKKYDKSNNLIRQVTTRASQAVEGKIGNLQVLEAIKDVFLDGTTSGWSIVVRYNQDGTYVTLATKKNKADVDLSGVMPLSLPPAGAYNEKETYQATYAANGSVISQTTVYSGSGAFEGPFSLKINGDQLFASGFMRYKLMTCYENPSDKNTPTIVPILGAVFLKNFIGLEFNEDNQSPIVYGGSISLTEAKGTLVKSGPRTQSSGTGGSSGSSTGVSSGSLKVGDAGSLTLNSVDTYTGVTTIAPGTLTLSGNNTYTGGMTLPATGR